MARKPSAVPAPDAAPRKPAREEIVEALMRLAAEQPWFDIEVADIAREAGVTLSAFRDAFPSKGAVLGGLSRMVDKQVLEGTTDELDDEPSRERLFDVLMRRLDALSPYKPALRRIHYALRFDPLALAALNGVALNSQRFMLAAAGIGTEGPLGRLRLQAAVVAFARTMETWLEDDEPDQARTLARLDRELTRADRFMERADDFRRLTAPFRALGRSLLERRARPRRRSRNEDGEEQAPAAAI